MAVSDSQVLASHELAPTDAIAVYADSPIPAPCTVMLELPVAALLDRVRAESRRS